MTTTQTSHTSDIELDNFGPDPNASHDAVMHASLLADASAPDGGYGWIIVLASAIVTFWFAGLSYTWGVMQAALVSQMGYSAPTLAFVGSLCPACIAIFAVLNARLIRVVGARWTAMSGMVMLGMGSILSGWSVGSVGGLFATFGVVGGVGTSLCFIVSCDLIEEGYVHRDANGSGRQCPSYPRSILKRSVASPMGLCMLVVDLVAQ